MELLPSTLVAAFAVPFGCAGVFLAFSTYTRSLRAQLWEIVDLLAIDQATMGEIERALRAHLAGSQSIDTAAAAAALEDFHHTKRCRATQLQALLGGPGASRLLPQRQLRLYRLNITRRDALLGRLDDLHTEILTGGPNEHH